MIYGLVLAVASMAMQPQGVESLGWMSGHWRTPAAPMPRDGPHWSEEIWTSAAGDLMVGASRSQRGFGRHYFSHMRIEEDEGVVTLHLSSSNGTVSAYRMIRSGNREASFDDAAAGARIFYQRVGDTLTVSYSRNDSSQAWTRRYVRVPARP